MEENVTGWFLWRNLKREGRIIFKGFLMIAQDIEIYKQCLVTRCWSRASCDIRCSFLPRSVHHT